MLKIIFIALIVAIIISTIIVSLTVICLAIISGKNKLEYKYVRNILDDEQERWVSEYCIKKRA